MCPLQIYLQFDVQKEMKKMATVFGVKRYFTKTLLLFFIREVKFVLDTIVGYVIAVVDFFA